MLLAMASETDKANALLQLFSTASVISSLGLGIFCYLADRLLQYSFIQQTYWLRALSDNMVHGIIGLWSWAIVIGLKKKSDFTEVILAGFLSSVIDMDHFILAGSLSLKLKDSWCFLPWMMFISWTSHHVRDGIRHGLWICPFGKTVPLPYWLYVAITATLPHLCSFLLYLTGTRELMSIKHGIRIDV
uniref:Transmembrane protein 267 n=1 Tax=Laticauda laticaudata TaxID=8630 RepID=A0A8C5SLP8_LATLA